MTTPRMTKPFQKHPEATILVIGHDPRLQKSNDIAEYAFYADYYFRPAPPGQSELRKFGLAKALFDYVAYLTGKLISPERVLATNLCNVELPHAPKNKTAYIPEGRAETGVKAIYELVRDNPIKLVLAMSQQVNYLLQKLNFYPPVHEYLTGSAPKEVGLNSQPPYYEATRNRKFTLICGKKFVTNVGVPIYPILHVKNWDMEECQPKNRFAAYKGSMDDCRASVITELSRTPL